MGRNEQGIKPDRASFEERSKETMKDNKVTIQLTNEQQKQIKSATGKSISQLHIDPAAFGNLTDKELDAVSGGATDYFLQVPNTDTKGETEDK